MIILGLNINHADSSASIISNGVLIAASEEERFTRIKNWAGIPFNSISFCLKKLGISIKDVDFITINKDQYSEICNKLLFTLTNNPSLTLLKERYQNLRSTRSISKKLADFFEIDNSILSKKIKFVEHHLSHLASSFFISDFKNASLLSVDGFGDFKSCMWGYGENNVIKPNGKILFPHSLGIFYLSITQFLGFNNYGEEYKVMGLSSYGDPKYYKKMSKMIELLPKGKFKLNLDYFLHHKHKLSMLWDNSKPKIEKVYSKLLEDDFGKSRTKGEKIKKFHMDIAASAQKLYEDVFFHILDNLYNETKEKKLVLSGGCAMNSVANGKILDFTKFNKIFVPPAPGDSGGAIGSAFLFYNQILKNPRKFVMKSASWGPEFTLLEIKKTIDDYKDKLQPKIFSVELVKSKTVLCEKTSKEISEGKIIGWFQGGMELGPRALGHRSILADPRLVNMKQILNSKIKLREGFRPFAPSILDHEVRNWFEKNHEVPFMSFVFKIKEEKKKYVPAITHVNGTGRLQSVNIKNNKLYYNLINCFFKKTKIPMLLNTSFNENEPIVCTPREAIECFLRTKMDVLVLENYMIKRR